MCLASFACMDVGAVISMAPRCTSSAPVCEGDCRGVAIVRLLGSNRHGNAEGGCGVRSMVVFRPGAQSYEPVAYGIQRGCGVWRPATGEDGFALLNEPTGYGDLGLQAFGCRCQPGERSFDATNVLSCVSHGVRDLGGQIGDPIRLGQIGAIRGSEFGVGIGLAAGKQRRDIPIGCVPCQLIAGNLRHVRIYDRKIKDRGFYRHQGMASRSLAPHHCGKFSFEDVGQKIANCRIALGHQYCGHGIHSIDRIHDIPFRIAHQMIGIVSSPLLFL